MRYAVPSASSSSPVISDVEVNVLERNSDPTAASIEPIAVGASSLEGRTPDKHFCRARIPDGANAAPTAWNPRSQDFSARKDSCFVEEAHRRGPIPASSSAQSHNRTSAC